METFKFDGLSALAPSRRAAASLFRRRTNTWRKSRFCRSNKLELFLVALYHFLCTMAKNKRKRKLKEQDFQKVKLKVGKKLQPAQNATDTSFKSRSVFIPNQLHKLDNEPTNQRNQTLKVRLSNWYYSLLTFNQTKSSTIQGVRGGVETRAEVGGGVRVLPYMGYIGMCGPCVSNNILLKKGKWYTLWY